MKRSNKFSAMEGDEFSAWNPEPPPNPERTSDAFLQMYCRELRCWDTKLYPCKLCPEKDSYWKKKEKLRKKQRSRIDALEKHPEIVPTKTIKVLRKMLEDVLEYKENPDILEESISLGEYIISRS